MIPCVLCPTAQGQWRVGVEVGSERFWGGSADTAGEGPSFRPYRPTSFGLGLARWARKWGAGVSFRYLSASLALEGAEGLVAVKGIFEVYGADAHLAYRVARVSANELTLETGPLLEVWSVSGEESQTRVGIQAGLSLRVPLGTGLVGSLTGALAVIASPFTESQLDSGFERRPLWRRRLAGGLELRL
jgi:hypothetical protein